MVTHEFEVIRRETLLSLPELEELRYNEDIRSIFTNLRDEIGSLNEMKQTLSAFLADARNLRK